MENRPRGRDRNIEGEGKGIFRRGDGLGTGPVGSQGSPSGGSGGPRRGMSHFHYCPFDSFAIWWKAIGNIEYFIAGCDTKWWHGTEYNSA